MPPPGIAQVRDAAIWVAPDKLAPGLRRARICGEGTVCFADGVRVRRAGLRQRRLIARPASAGSRRGELTTSRLALSEGEVLEVRP
jgi:hypothetical protein